MRVNFELKFSADTLEAAKSLAYEEVSKFLGVEESAVADSVDLELKVGIPDPEKNIYSGHFIITAFGSLKKSVIHPGK
jgi:hypothetical protein